MFTLGIHAQQQLNFGPINILSKVENFNVTSFDIYHVSKIAHVHFISRASRRLGRLEFYLFANLSIYLSVCHVAFGPPEVKNPRHRNRKYLMINYWVGCVIT